MEPTAPLAVVALLLAWLAVKIGFVGAAVWLSVARPELLAHIQQVYRDQGGRCYLFGIVNGLLLTLIVLVLLSAKILALLGILILAALLGAIVAGYAAGYANLGQRVYGLDASQNSVQTMLVGGAIAEAAFFTPIVGQVLSILMLFRGLGAVALTLLARRRAGRNAASPVVEQSPNAQRQA